MFTRPADREVVCHASAWQMDGGEDLRIKQCILPTEEDLYTIYHELGHTFYALSYIKQPYLFKDGAHDGFHEAVGDTINLSMTEGYLSGVGLLPKGAKSSREALVNRQMKVASEKIAFLPFGKLVDQWRWGVFSGAIPPGKYNEAWWELRRKYQGVDSPVPRSEADFDPGAKYHVPGNTPLYALLPLIRHAVPVPPRALREGGVQGPAARRVARSGSSKKPAAASRKCSRSVAASPGRTH